MKNDEVLQSLGRIEATLNDHTVRLQKLEDYRNWLLGISTAVSAGIALITEIFTRGSGHAS